jgi:hypothetical protein
VSGFFKLPLGVTLLPAVEADGIEVCTARDCHEIARLALFMGDDDGMGVNDVCPFHALVYTSLAINDLVRVRESDDEIVS